MNPERFLVELAAAFDDFPHAPLPRDRMLARVQEELPGLSTENTLMLVHVAAAALPHDERYLEIGSYRGRSLVAALLGTHAEAVAIDDFSREGGSRDALDQALERFEVAGRARVIEGDGLELLRDGLDGNAAPVGVFYYDAAHDYESQRGALELVRPLLAERALLVVDDSDWDAVGRADRDFLREEPRARLLLDLPGKEHGRPQWWSGMHVLAWDAHGHPAHPHHHAD